MRGDDEPELADRVRRLTGEAVRSLRPLGASHRWRLFRAELSDGREAFVKALADPDPVLRGVFHAEAEGLRWLGSAPGAPVPEVYGADSATLAIAWVPESGPDPAAAERLGRELAALHSTGAPQFGAPWPGYIAELPLDNSPLVPPSDGPSRDGPSRDGASRDGASRDGVSRDGVSRDGAAGDREPAYGASSGRGSRGGTPVAGGAGVPWGEWYAARRLEPYLRRAVEAGGLRTGDVRIIERVIERIGELGGPPEPPARIHGDLWAGNVLWTPGRALLIDPAAHGGHRETDLAMLALFGAPHLERLLAAYTEATPLADGWRERIPLHQLHPLLVHVCLFGAAYRHQTVAAAKRALATA